MWVLNEILCASSVHVRQGTSAASIDRGVEVAWSQDYAFKKGMEVCTMQTYPTMTTSRAFILAVHAEPAHAISTASHSCAGAGNKQTGCAEVALGGGGVAAGSCNGPEVAPAQDTMDPAGEGSIPGDNGNVGQAVNEWETSTAAAAERKPAQGILAGTPLHGLSLGSNAADHMVASLQPAPTRRQDCQPAVAEELTMSAAKTACILRGGLLPSTSVGLSGQRWEFSFGRWEVGAAGCHAKGVTSGRVDLNKDAAECGIAPHGQPDDVSLTLINPLYMVCRPVTDCK